MNIFVLDKSPKLAAQMHCDKHVVKMILESAQMLCTVAHVVCDEAIQKSFTPQQILDAVEFERLKAKIPYKPTHVNHPCTIWARESQHNFLWLYTLFCELNAEWQYRYDHTTSHMSFDKISFVNLLLPIATRLSIQSNKLTPFAQAMPDEYKNEDPVEAYRTYYKNDKVGILQYTKRPRPEWLNNI